jgi:hypothetical protein
MIFVIFGTHRHIGHIVFLFFILNETKKLCVLCAYVFQKRQKNVFILRGPIFQKLEGVADVDFVGLPNE